MAIAAANVRSDMARACYTRAIGQGRWCCQPPIDEIVRAIIAIALDPLLAKVSNGSPRARGLGAVLDLFANLAAGKRL
jgi:hypothetical protein